MKVDVEGEETKEGWLIVCCAVFCCLLIVDLFVCVLCVCVVYFGVFALALAVATTNKSTECASL